jgi:hypothetical protein
MPSSGKRKTTMAKLARERRLQERRLDKQARKEARRLAAAHQPAPHGDGVSGEVDGGGDLAAGQPDLGSVPQTLPDD